MHLKNHVRALDQINIQLATWEIEEWTLRLNPLGALGQVVLADGNAQNASGWPRVARTAKQTSGIRIQTRTRPRRSRNARFVSENAIQAIILINAQYLKWRIST